MIRFRRAVLPAPATDVQAHLDAKKKADSLIVVEEPVLSRHRIENVLNAFVAGLIQAASVEREHRIRREKRAREQAERERRQPEWQKRKKAEERQLWALFTDAECWQKSQHWT